jgi:hypothetical protein
MKKLASHVIALCGLAVFAGESLGQFGPRPGFGGGGVRPTVSPYLNIVNGGNDAAINYFGLVRPQVAFGRAIQNLNNDFNFLDSNASQLNQQNQTSQTGHRSSFMTQGRYFMNNGYGSGVTGGNQYSFRPGSVLGSNTIAGGNQNANQARPSGR